MREDILNLYKICLKQNYLKFDSKYYVAENCLGMDKFLSPLSAEIFMDHLEKKISKHLLLQIYVDYILASYTESNRHLEKFNNFINNLHSKISFTKEIVVNSNINILDLSLTKIDNNIFFGIFHKPIHADMLIHST